MINGPLLYQIQQEIASIKQGNEKLQKYFTKLKRLWDELQCLRPAPNCVCHGKKEMIEQDSQTKLMQFLMGLNNNFDHAKNQILIMDPAPTVAKAYSMLVAMEQQRESKGEISDKEENSAMFAKADATRIWRGSNRGRGGHVSKGTFRKPVCSHCGMEGHLKEGCFKLVGYPDWFKVPKEQRGKYQRSSVNMVDTPFTGLEEGSSSFSLEEVKTMREFMKIFKGGKAEKANIAFDYLQSGPEE